MNDVKFVSTTPWIELRLWRQFVAVAEELHFSRAAMRLHMTQPPLTQAIAQLEGLLGFRLFDRTKRSVQMTAAGAALLPQARDVLARAQALPAYGRASADGEAGRLRLAFVSTVGFDLLPRWVRAFRQQHPRVELELIEATGDVQLQAFERGEIDAGFILHSPGFAPPAMSVQRVAIEKLVLAMPAQLELALRKDIRVKDVLSQPLVIFPRRIAPSLYDAIFAMYHAAGQLPQVAQEAIQMQTVVNLVAAGLGVAWVPESVQQYQRSGVVYCSFDSTKRPHRDVRSTPPQSETSLVWREASNNPVLVRFLRFVRQDDSL